MKRRHSLLNKLLEGKSIRIGWDQSEYKLAKHLKDSKKKINYCGLPCTVTSVSLQASQCMVELDSSEEDIAECDIEKDIVI